jgi:ABC-type uncharacterized transport system substrate-binding protein
LADRILKGAKLTTCRSSSRRSSSWLINLKTVKGFGLTIPQSLQLRADRLIQ